MIEPQSAHDGESAETEKATFGPPPSSTPPAFKGLIGRAEEPLACPFEYAKLEWTGRSVPPTALAGGGSAIIADALGPPASPMLAV